ncbi:MAG: zf-HC2 domain-containing protein [Planctomycetota bacterium]
MITGPFPAPAASRACAGRVDDIHRYLDGEMLPRDREAMQRHLRACAGCDAYHEGMKSFHEAVQRVLRLESPANPSGATVRRMMISRVEALLQEQVAERLCDLAKVALARIDGLPLHIAGPVPSEGAVRRRLREIVQQRHALGEQRRAVRGPWHELRDCAGLKSGCGETPLSADVSEILELGMGILEKAQQFVPVHGRTHLMKATFARASGDTASAWEGSVAAMLAEDTKVRAMAHLALAHLCLGAEGAREAERHLCQSHTYDENSPWPHYGLALVTFVQGLTRETRRHLKDLGTALDRCRRPEAVRRSIANFLGADTELLARRFDLNKLKRIHFVRLVTQAAGEHEPDVNPSMGLEVVPGAGAWEIP